MSKCKTKAIQTDLGTFRHNETYPGPEACSEPWHINNPGIFRTPVSSERCHI